MSRSYSTTEFTPGSLHKARSDGTLQQLWQVAAFWVFGVVGFCISGVALAEQHQSHTDKSDSAAAVNAHWRLDAANSELSFVTVKAADIAEAHTIAELSGGVTPGASATASGELNLKIHLDSVNTNIPIRDERVREHLFETGQHPTAAVHGHLPLADYLALTVGDSTSASLNLMLDLKALRVPVTAEVLVSRLGADRFMVTSSKPIIINAASVGLVTGIDKLQQLASLPSISKAVPVSFVLTFVR